MRPLHHQKKHHPDNSPESLWECLDIILRQTKQGNYINTIMSLILDVSESFGIRIYGG